MLFVIRQLKVAPWAQLGAAKANGWIKFFLWFCDWTIVEAKFFTLLDVFSGEHPDAVVLGRLPNFDHCLAVWVAAVAQPRAEITMDYGVDCENIVSLWIIDVAFKGDIVEVR